jgi:hypothetical protein
MKATQQASPMRARTELIDCMRRVVSVLNPMAAKMAGE